VVCSLQKENEKSDTWTKRP